MYVLMCVFAEFGLLVTSVQIESHYIYMSLPAYMWHIRSRRGPDGLPGADEVIFARQSNEAIEDATVTYADTLIYSRGDAIRFVHIAVDTAAEEEAMRAWLTDEANAFSVQERLMVLLNTGRAWIRR